MDGQLPKRENCAVVEHRRYLSPPAWFVRMRPNTDMLGMFSLLTGRRDETVVEGALMAFSRLALRIG